MYYSSFRNEWFSSRLARTFLFNHTWAGLLTIGHLRTLEALHNPLFTSSEQSVDTFAMAQIIVASQMEWKTFKRRVEKASLRLRWAIARAEPKSDAEIEVFFDWFTRQQFYPTAIHQSKEEIEALNKSRARAFDHAALPSLRLAAAIAAIPGWSSLLSVKSPWDVTLISANHLLAAHAENRGAFHFNAQLVEGLNNG